MDAARRWFGKRPPMVIQRYTNSGDDMALNINEDKVSVINKNLIPGSILLNSWNERDST